MANIFIAKGTKVLACYGKPFLVELLCDVYVEATRAEDGGYDYEVGGKPYYVAAGTVSVFPKMEGTPIRHKDGLVTLG